jgi:hypothetical protein
MLPPHSTPVKSSATTAVKPVTKREAARCRGEPLVVGGEAMVEEEAERQEETIRILTRNREKGRLTSRSRGAL